MHSFPPIDEFDLQLTHPTSGMHFSNIFLFISLLVGFALEALAISGPGAVAPGGEKARPVTLDDLEVPALREVTNISRPHDLDGRVLLKRGPITASVIIALTTAASLWGKAAALIGIEAVKLNIKANMSWNYVI